MVFVVFLGDVGFRLSLEVFVDGFVVLVGTTARGTSVVAASEVVVLEGRGKESSGLGVLG